MKDHVSSSEALRGVYLQCAEIIDGKCFYDWKSSDGKSQNHQSIMCHIHDALITGDQDANSLGNCLNEAMDDLMEYLRSGPCSGHLHRNIRDFIFRQYLIVEKVYEALSLVGLKDDRFRLSTNGMRTLQDINKWANFFKHPGAFVLCHAPQYYCLSVANPPTSTGKIVIDQEFVNASYVEGEKKRGLYEKLENKRNVIVVFPDLIDLSNRFAAGLTDFCETMKSPFFRDLLRKKSTYEAFYSELDESNKITDTSQQIG